MVAPCLPRGLRRIATIVRVDHCLGMSFAKLDRQQSVLREVSLLRKLADPSALPAVRERRSLLRARLQSLQARLDPSTDDKDAFCDLVAAE